MTLDDRIDMDQPALDSRGAEFYRLSSFRQYAVLDTGNGKMLFVEQVDTGMYRLVADGTCKPSSQQELPYDNGGHDAGDEHR